MGNYGRGHLARSVRYLIVVALLLFWPLRALAAIDAHSEVAAALYAASATHDAAERLADARLRAGDAKLQARLTAAPQAYVAALSARDRAYAQEIAVFRAAVSDIAATPAGLAALARFNAGDEAGALAILDDVRRAAALPGFCRVDILPADGRAGADLAVHAPQWRHAVRFRGRSGVRSAGKAPAGERKLRLVKGGGGRLPARVAGRDAPGAALRARLAADRPCALPGLKFAGACPSAASVPAAFRKSPDGC